MNQLVHVQSTNAEIYRASTDAADLCRAIVLQTAVEIQDRRYVKVEGWQAIAIAHGCTAGARDVEAIEGGVRAIGEVRRMSDGGLIATAEGFVGMDETTWYGGTTRAWKWGQKKGEKIWYDKESPKRPDYAIRAMAQTRAISRACRSAFAHVVVMIDAGLSTTPAEEVPMGGFDDDRPMTNVTPPKDEPKTSVAVTAAQTAFTMANTQAELEAWLDLHEPNFPSLFNKAELAIVEHSYGQRYAALAPAKDSFRSGASSSVAGRAGDDKAAPITDDDIPENFR